MPKIRTMEHVGLQAGERLRETTLRPPMHQTRDADAAAYDLRPEEVMYDSSPTNMPHVTPRPGYKQRWVRTNDRNSPGDRNYESRYIDGWRPRPVETIPEMFKVYCGAVKGAMAPTDFQVGQNVLCEMPEDLWAKRMLGKKGKQDRLREIASEAIARVDQKGAGIIGAFSESSQSVQVGRRPAVMAG